MFAPIYQQIAVRLEAYIREHGITGKLPGTRQLSRELVCYHVTLAKAIRLQDPGLKPEKYLAPPVFHDAGPVSAPLKTVQFANRSNINQ